MTAGGGSAVTPDLTERIRAIAPERLDLLLRRLNALRPPAGGTWLAEPVLVPLRFHGPLDGAALQRALDGLAGGPGGSLTLPAVLDLRELPRAERSAAALRAAMPETAGDAPLRALLTRLDHAEHLLVLAVRPAADAPAPGALVRHMQARYDEAVRGPSPPLPAVAVERAHTAEALLAEVESFSDDDVELLLGQLETGAGLHAARVASAPVDPASAEALLAEIDQLGDDDVEALLRQLSDV